MRKGFLLTGIIVVSALLGFSASAEQEEYDKWSTEQKIDEFGDVTDEIILKEIVKGTYTNTTMADGPLTVEIYDAGGEYSFRVLENNTVPATYYSDASIKTKVDDIVKEFHLNASSSVNDAVSVSVAQRLLDTDIISDEGYYGYDYIGNALDEGKDIKCIIKTGNSSYSFTITHIHYKNAKNEYYNSDYFKEKYLAKDESEYEDEYEEPLPVPTTITDMSDVLYVVCNDSGLNEECIKYVQEHFDEYPLVDNNNEYLPYLFPHMNLAVFPINDDYTYMTYKVRSEDENTVTAEAFVRKDEGGIDSIDYLIAGTENGATPCDNGDKSKWIIQASDGQLIWYSVNEIPYYKLKTGDRGERVQILQQALIEQGYLSGSADGIFGDGTASGVISFQRSVGIEETGIADTITQIKLFTDEDSAEYIDRLIKLYDGYYLVEHTEVATGNIEYQIYAVTELGGKLIHPYEEVIRKMKSIP